MFSYLHIIENGISYFTVDPILKPGEVMTHYNVSKGIDYTISFSFGLTPNLEVFNWYYGSSFQDRSKVLMIPTETKKFATSFMVTRNTNFCISNILILVSNYTNT